MWSNMIWPTLPSQQSRLLHCVCSPPFLCSLTNTIVLIFFICLCFSMNLYCLSICKASVIVFSLYALACLPTEKNIAIFENDATRYHQSNSINLIIGQHQSNFDIFWWMIRHTCAQYANVKQCGTLIQFTVYVAKEKCTETAPYDLLMNLH